MIDISWIDFSSPFPWFILAVVCFIVMILSVGNDGFVLLSSVLCIVSIFFVVLSGMYINNDIESNAIEDYQNYNVSLDQYSNDNIYKNKIDEMYDNELEIYPDVKLQDRFRIESKNTTTTSTFTA